jgi:hypothetical protein
MVLPKSQITHRLHPRGLELPMSIMRMGGCIDYLHLHLQVCVNLGCLATRQKLENIPNAVVLPLDGL